MPAKPPPDENRTYKIQYRANEAEYSAVQRLAAHLDEPSYGTAARQGAVALGVHLAKLEEAVQAYEEQLGTAATGAALVKRARRLIAAAHGKE